MSLFGGFRARRLAQRAYEAFARAGFDAAAGVLDGGRGLGGEAWAHFAVELYNRGDRSAAEQAVRRTLALEPGRGDALIFLAELLAETERVPEAIATYRQVLGRFPGAAKEAVALARLLAAEDD